MEWRGMVRQGAIWSSDSLDATASSTTAGGEVMPPVKVVIITLILIIAARFMSGEMGAIW